MTKDIKPLYGIGDKVKIINYGHLIWESATEKSNFPFNVIFENDKIRALDISPFLIGQIGIVSDVSSIQGIPSYALNHIDGKHAWYDEAQMELITKNHNK